LTNGKHLNSFMRSDEVALQIINPAAVKLVFAKMRTQKRLIILSGHETNFLAIGFVCDLEVKFSCDRTNLRFRHPTKRRKRTLQLFLPETKQEIRLILPRIDSFTQHHASVAAFVGRGTIRRGIGMFNNRVMPRRDVIAPERLGTSPKLS